MSPVSTCPNQAAPQDGHQQLTVFVFFNAREGNGDPGFGQIPEKTIAATSKPPQWLLVVCHAQDENEGLQEDISAAATFSIQSQKSCPGQVGFCADLI